MVASAWRRAQCLFQSQTVSCLTLSPGACRAAIWPNSDSANPLCSCPYRSIEERAPASAQNAEPPAQCIEAGHGRCMLADLVSFLLAAKTATNGYLYVCLPVGPPLCLTDSEKEQGRVCTAHTVAPPDAPLDGGTTATEKPAWLCCCVFRLIHRLYGILSSGSGASDIFLLPVEAERGWRRNFLNAVAAHVRTFPTVQTPCAAGNHSAFIRNSGTKCRKTKPGHEENSVSITNFIDPNFRFTDTSFCEYVQKEPRLRTVCLDSAVARLLASDQVEAGRLRAECVFSASPSSEDAPAFTQRGTTGGKGDHLASSESAATAPGRPESPACATSTLPPSSRYEGDFSPGQDACPSANNGEGSGATGRPCALPSSPPWGPSESRLCSACMNRCPLSPDDAADTVADGVRIAVPFPLLSTAKNTGSPMCSLSERGGSDPSTSSASRRLHMPLCRFLQTEFRLGHLVVAGAFDRLHAGHKILLTATALLARDRVGLAVTSGELIARKVKDPFLALASGIEPFCLRSRSAAAFLALVIRATGRKCVFENYTEQVLREELRKELGNSPGTTTERQARAPGEDSLTTEAGVEVLWRQAYDQATQIWSPQASLAPGEKTARNSSGDAGRARVSPPLWSGAVDGRYLSDWLPNEEGDSRGPKAGSGEVGICLYCIEDPLGPAGDLAFDGLVVSAESVGGGQFVNAEREKRRNPPVALVEVPTLPPQSARGADAPPGSVSSSGGGTAQSSESPEASRARECPTCRPAEAGKRAFSAECAAPGAAAVKRARREEASAKLSSTALRSVQASRLRVTQADMERMFTAFHRAAATVIGAAEPVRNAYWTVFCEMFSAPWRRFSSFARLKRLLNLLETITGETTQNAGGLSERQRASVALALWFACAFSLPRPLLWGLEACRVSQGDTCDARDEKKTEPTQSAPLDLPDARASLAGCSETGASEFLWGCFFDASCAAFMAEAICRATDEGFGGETSRSAAAGSAKISSTSCLPADEGACANADPKRRAFSAIRACVAAARALSPFLSPFAALRGERAPEEATDVPVCCRAIGLVELRDIAVPWSEYVSRCAEPFMEENSCLVGERDYRALRATQIRAWLSRYHDDGRELELSALSLQRSEINQIVSNLKRELDMLSATPNSAGASCARRTTVPAANEPVASYKALLFSFSAANTQNSRVAFANSQAHVLWG